MVITKPSEPVYSGSCDNSNADYIFKVGDIITSTNTNENSKSSTYIVEALLGQGSFGQVLRCLCKENHHTYAVKVIKSHSAYTKQAEVECKILEDV